VPEVVSQLAYRVLGPYKNRARSVMEWTGVFGPTVETKDVASKYGVTAPAIGQRVQRVAAAEALLPLDPHLELEIIRPSRPDEDQRARERWARLLGRESLQ
jgi:hypothetical protein